MSNSPESVVQAYFEALNASDAKALAALFDEQGTFMGGETPTTTGPDAIRAMATAAFESISCSHTFEVDAVERRDGIAIIQTHSAGKLTLRAEGKTTDDSHRELFALREGDDGWRITHYMYNGGPVNGAAPSSHGSTGGDEQPSALVRSLESPEEVRRLADAGRIDLVQLGAVTVGRATFEPGWRWSEHVKPIAGTELCEATHVGYVLSGRQAVRMADGAELELEPGDAFVVGPGHDAWVLGDEPCVSLDFSGIAEFAR